MQIKLPFTEELATEEDYKLLASSVEYQEIGGQHIYTEKGKVSPSSPIYWACRSVLTNAVMSAHFRIVNRETGQPAKSEKLDILLNPSREFSYEQVWRTFVEGLIGDGNGYIYKDGTGSRTELIPAISGKASRTTAGNPITYELTLANAANTKKEFKQIDLIAVHGAGYNGVESPSPIQNAAGPSFKLNDILVKHVTDSAQAGVRGSSVLQIDSEKDLTSQEVKQLATVLRENYTEARKNGNIPVLPNKIKIGTMTASTMQDLQLIEIKRYTSEDICRIFGVPTRMVNIFDRGIKVSTLAEQVKDFQIFTVDPLCRKIADAINFSMFNPDENKVILDTSNLAEGTEKDKVDNLTKLIEKSVLTPNEVRGELGFAPIEGGDRLSQPSGSPGLQPNGNSEEDE